MRLNEFFPFAWISINFHHIQILKIEILNVKKNADFLLKILQIKWFLIESLKIEE